MFTGVGYILVGMNRCRFHLNLSLPSFSLRSKFFDVSSPFSVLISLRLGCEFLKGMKFFFLSEKVRISIWIVQMCN